MSEIIDVITKLSYISEDEGLKKSSQNILKLTGETHTLAIERQKLADKQAALTAKDVAGQKAVLLQIQKVETQIKANTKAIIAERLANSDLNKEITKEVGLINNLNAKMDALKTKKAMATTANEVRAVNREIKALGAELNKLEGKGGARGGGFSNLLSGITGGIIGGGVVAGIMTLGRALTGLFSDSLREAGEAEQSILQFTQTLRNLGRTDLVDELIADASTLAKRFKDLFDNDDILAGQAKFIEGTRVTKRELKALMPVAIELAAKLGTDVVTASEMLVNALVGRTSAELKRLGLNMKDAKTQTERVNLVLGDFAKILSGSVDTALETTAGKSKQLSQAMANAEEELGNRLIPLQKKLLEFKLWAANLVMNVIENEGDRTTNAIDARAKAFTRRLKAQESGISDDRLRAAIVRQKDEVDFINERIEKNNKIIEQHKSIDATMEAETRNRELNNQLINKQAGLTALANIQEERKQKIEKDGPINPNAGLDDPIEKVKKEKAAKRKKTEAELAEEFRQRTEKEFNDNLKLREEYNQKELYLIEILNSTGALTEIEYNDLLLERQLKFYEEQIIFLTDYGKDVYKIRIDQLKALEKLEDSARAKAKTRIAKEGTITGEFLPGTTGAIEVGAEASVFTKEGEAKRIQDGKDQVGRNKTLAESFAEVNTIIQSVGQSINDVTQQQIDSIDREIDAQEGRISRALKYAERGGAALLEQEEERLAKLEERREAFARRQLVINNALALSNAVLAVATAAGQTGAGAIAVVPAVIAAIAAGYGVVTALTEPQSFAEGTKSVEGQGTETSDSVPARLSRGERVMTAKRSRQFRPVLDDIQDGKFKSIDDLYSKIRTGEYNYGMNYQGAIESRTADNTNALLIGEVRSLREAIEDKPVAQMNADENGLAMYYINFQRRIQKRNKY